MPRTGLVQVTLMDAGTGRQLGRTELAAAQLPDSFAKPTQLDLGGSAWTVVRADPPTAAEFLASGSLVLTLRQVETVDPQKVGYTIPTFFDPLPGTENFAGPGDLLVLHEDDWRQTELVSRQLLSQVETELHEIRQIHQRHSRPLGEGIRGFDRLHLRHSPAEPLSAPFSHRRLTELLPTPTRTYAGVTFRDTPGRALNSFALTTGALTLYGQRNGDDIAVLALTGEIAACADGLAQVMREADLLLVDWCGGRVLEASEIAD